MTKLRNCPDCDVAPGEHHMNGCDVERCPRCGHQLISCECIYAVNGMDVATLEEKHPDIFVSGPTPEMEKKWNDEWGLRRMPWTGIWPGVVECEEYGFWSVLSKTKGWVSVSKETPGAGPDLNRLYKECVWDPEKQRMVKRGAS